MGAISRTASCLTATALVIYVGFFVVEIPNADHDWESERSDTGLLRRLVPRALDLRNLVLVDGSPSPETLNALRRGGEGLGAETLSKILGIDLRARNLRGANFDGAYLPKVDFGCDEKRFERETKTFLENSSTDGTSIVTFELRTVAEAEASWLACTKLQGASFIRTTMPDSNLQRAHLKGVVMQFARLRGSNFKRARLDGAYLVAAHLEGATLNFANLDGALFIGANLEAADFRHSSLRGANFLTARLEGASLDGADFSGSNLIEAYWRPTPLSSKYPNPPDFTFTNITDINLLSWEQAIQHLEEIEKQKQLPPTAKKNIRAAIEALASSSEDPENDLVVANLETALCSPSLSADASCINASSREAVEGYVSEVLSLRSKLACDAASSHIWTSYSRAYVFVEGLLELHRLLLNEESCPITATILERQKSALIRRIVIEERRSAAAIRKEDNSDRGSISN